MRLSWSELQEVTKADWVGGDLIARINDAHVVLANKRGDVKLTEAGEALAVSMYVKPAEPRKVEALPAAPISSPPRKKHTPENK